MFIPIIIIGFHVEFASPQYPSIKCGRCCNSINVSAETLPTLTMQVVSCRPISWCLPGVVGSQHLIEDILKAIEVNNLVTYNSQLLHQAEFRLSATLDHHLKNEVLSPDHQGFRRLLWLLPLKYRVPPPLFSLLSAHRFLTKTL